MLGGKEVKAEYPCVLPEPARWRAVLGQSQGENQGYVDFCALYGQKSDFRLGYAVARVRAERDFEGELWLGSDDSLAVWVNGESVFRLVTGRSATPASDKAPVRLKQGENTILLKLDNVVGGWAFYFDLRDKDGKMPTEIEFLSPAVPVQK